MRSPSGMRFATRRSSNTVHGVVPALRPRLPSSCCSVGVVPLRTNGTMHGSCKTPVGEYLELTGRLPLAVQTGSTTVLGRPVSDDNCRLSPLLVMMLKGRPDANSMRGANVQSLKNLLPKPSPPSLPV